MSGTRAKYTIYFATLSTAFAPRSPNEPHSKLANFLRMKIKHTHTVTRQEHTHLNLYWDRDERQLWHCCCCCCCTSIFCCHYVKARWVQNVELSMCVLKSDMMYTYTIHREKNRSIILV